MIQFETKSIILSKNKQGHNMGCHMTKIYDATLVNTDETVLISYLLLSWRHFLPGHHQV